MNNKTYSELAIRTAPTVDSFENKLLLAAVGLGGETGEVLEVIKKHVFHKHPLDRQRLIKEMGDVEWYANLLRVLLETSLEEVHQTNIDKLSARYPEGFFSTERSIHRQEGDE